MKMKLDYDPDDRNNAVLVSLPKLNIVCLLCARCNLDTHGTGASVFDTAANDPGAFWMTFEDFHQNYATVFVCRLLSNWHKVSCSGQWTGGPHGFAGTPFTSLALHHVTVACPGSRGVLCWSRRPRHGQHWPPQSSVPCHSEARHCCILYTDAEVTAIGRVWRRHYQGGQLTHTHTRARLSGCCYLFAAANPLAPSSTSWPPSSPVAPQSRHPSLRRSWHHQPLCTPGRREISARCPRRLRCSRRAPMC